MAEHWDNHFTSDGRCNCGCPDCAVLVECYPGVRVVRCICPDCPCGSLGPITATVRDVPKEFADG